MEVNVKDYLKVWADLENKELLSSLVLLPKEEKWMIEIFKLLQLFENNAKNINFKWNTSIRLSCLANQEIHLCFLAYFRKHISLSYSCIRSAVESATFIRAIKDDQVKAEVWMKRQWRDIYDKDFNQLKVDGRQGKLGKNLKEDFDIASERSHANFYKTIYSVNSKADFENKKIIDRYGFFDDPDIKTYRKSAIQLISICFHILQVFDEIFKEFLEKTIFPEQLKQSYTGFRQFLKGEYKDLIVDKEILKKFEALGQ